MDISWLTEMISDAISYFFGVVLLTTAGAGIMGLITGIIVVVVLGRNGVFTRSFAAWTSFAKLNYIFIPVCFTVMLGLMGAIYGVQIQMDDWVDYTAMPITAIGKKALPVVQFMGAELSTYGELDDAIYDFADTMFEGHGYLDRACGFFFNHYTHMLLNEFGYSETVAGLVQMANAHDFANPSPATIQRLPNAVKSYYGVAFREGYLHVFWMVFPYLLIPVVEYALFWFIDRTRKKEEGLLDFEGIKSEYV